MRMDLCVNNESKSTFLFWVHQGLFFQVSWKFAVVRFWCSDEPQHCNQWHVRMTLIMTAGQGSSGKSQVLVFMWTQPNMDSDKVSTRMAAALNWIVTFRPVPWINQSDLDLGSFYTQVNHLFFIRSSGCSWAVFVVFDLQRCLGGWIVSVGVLWIFRIQVFPAEYCTVARWWMLFISAVSRLNDVTDPFIFSSGPETYHVSFSRVCTVCAVSAWCYCVLFPCNRSNMFFIFRCCTLHRWEWESCPHQVYLW